MGPLLTPHSSLPLNPRAAILQVAMTFGKDHPCGNKPERVSTLMRNNLVARAAQYPSCFVGSLSPSPPPSPPSPRPPPRPPNPPPRPPNPPPSANPFGTWDNPWIIDSLPFLSDQLNVSGNKRRWARGASKGKRIAVQSGKNPTLFGAGADHG